MQPLLKLPRRCCGAEPSGWKGWRTREYVDDKNDIADAETRVMTRSGSGRDGRDGPREKVAPYDGGDGTEGAAVRKADIDEAAQREAALMVKRPRQHGAAVALCVVADNIEALLEAVHENLPSDSIEDADCRSATTPWRCSTTRRKARRPSARRRSAGADAARITNWIALRRRRADREGCKGGPRRLRENRRNASEAAPRAAV